MKFSPDTLLLQLRKQPAAPCYTVAFSGGLDSQVLLHALHALRERLDADIAAVHVHHGLQADADTWETHCRQVCDELGVACTTLRVDGRAARGESPEAAAREARYRALAAWLPPYHCLLTAQHRDDQAETLLLQLLRGSGVAGLAAMPVITPLGAGHHLRPLLDVTRADLHDYATQHRLSWIEDPSNRSMAFDRNYLRHRVLPLLRERWPAVSASLSRSAAHCAEANALIGQLAERDLQSVAGGHAGTLSVSGLLALPPERHRNVLRHWLKQHTRQTPSTAVLARIVNDVLRSRPDAGPCVRWGLYQVRRYRDDLYCLPQHAHRDMTGLDWSLSGPLALPGAGGVLTATPAAGAGIRRADAEAHGVRVSWRRGGERCQPAGRGHHHSLKKLFQEQGVPPWERERIPLIYIQERLATVPGLWVCEPFQAGPDEPGMMIDWDSTGVPSDWAVICPGSPMGN